MVILHNPQNGADIESDFLTLKAGNSIEVTQHVAKQAQNLWGFLSITESVPEEPVSEESVIEEPVAVEEPKEDLKSMTVTTLRQKAKEVGVKYSGLTKTELVRKLRRKV